MAGYFEKTVRFKDYIEKGVRVKKPATVSIINKDTFINSVGTAFE